MILILTYVLTLIGVLFLNISILATGDCYPQGDFTTGSVRRHRGHGYSRRFHCIYWLAIMFAMRFHSHRMCECYMTYHGGGMLESVCLLCLYHCVSFSSFSYLHYLLQLVAAVCSLLRHGSSLYWFVLDYHHKEPIHGQFITFGNLLTREVVKPDHSR